MTQIIVWSICDSWASCLRRSSDSRRRIGLCVSWRYNF